MTSLTKQLKASVKAVKNGTMNAPRPAPELPQGAMLDAAGNFVLPPTPAACADLLYATREKRLALQRLAERHQELETALSEHFILTLPKSDATGISGRVARVQITVKAVPQVDGEEGWEKLHKYIIKTGSWELLQRRLGESAAKELLEDGQGAKAGITVFQSKRVSCTKL